MDFLIFRRVSVLSVLYASTVYERIAVERPSFL